MLKDWTEMVNYYKTMNKNIYAVNFSIATICSAKCIFCPTDKGQSSSQKIMSYEIFKEILRRIKRSKYIADTLEVIRLDELGDLVLNPCFIDMLRLVRKEFPGVKIELHNHFYLLNNNLAKSILTEKLIDCLIINIDGIEKTYEVVKNVRYNVFLGNFKYFIALRDKLKLYVPVYVRSLTLRNYLDVLKNNFGYSPNVRGVQKTRDDFSAIRKLLSNIVDFKLDTHERAFVSLWAERETLDVNKNSDLNKYSCPMYFRLQREIFIAPNGNWYLCCLDSKQELILGNLLTEDIDVLISSERRKKYLDDLIHKNFKLVGGPCTTVNCCQIYHRIPLVSRFYRLMAKYFFISQLVFDLKHVKKRQHVS